MKRDTLIKLNPEFLQDCIYDIAENERISKKYYYKLKSYSDVSICDGNTLHLIPPQTIQDLEETFYDYLQEKWWNTQESNWLEREDINNRNIDELERFDFFLELLNKDMITQYEEKLNKIFYYIEQNY